MNIAIYPRKSKFSPTSESIANQVAMCREYCDRCFDDPHYLVSVSYTHLTLPTIRLV